MTIAEMMIAEGAEIIDLTKDFEGIVLCDLCNTEYTKDDGIMGGFLNGSYAVCPLCAPDHMKSIIHYGEQDRVIPNPDLTFYDFVIKSRG